MATRSVAYSESTTRISAADWSPLLNADTSNADQASIRFLRQSDLAPLSTVVAGNWSFFWLQLKEITYQGSVKPSPIFRAAQRLLSSENCDRIASNFSGVYRALSSRDIASTILSAVSFIFSACTRSAGFVE
jgi:hypothetical protein